MKKVPEKLYITNDDKRFGDKCHSASTEKHIDDDIEYIRADAFIEETVNWLINNTDITPTGIKNYRKAMKGK